MLNFFKLSLLSACLVNTAAFASGHPNNQEAEETTFISAPLLWYTRGGNYHDAMSLKLSVNDTWNHERSAWIGEYSVYGIQYETLYFSDPEAKIVQVNDWVYEESCIAIVYRASYHNGGHRLYLLPQPMELTYEGKLEINLDEWYPVNEPGRVGWAKRTANGVKALTNLRLFIKPPTKG